MIEKRPDWCVSRQRFWACPSSFSTARLRKAPEDFKALRNVVNGLKEEGADAWYKHSSEKLLPTHGVPMRSVEVRKDDILDVWFDSGSSNLSC